MSALMTKALPVWRWQSLQWQQCTNIGAALSLYFTAPQKHCPFNAFAMSPSPPVPNKCENFGFNSRLSTPSLSRSRQNLHAQETKTPAHEHIEQTRNKFKAARISYDEKFTRGTPARTSPTYPPQRTTPSS